MELERFSVIFTKHGNKVICMDDGKYVRYDDIKHLLNSAQQPLTGAESARKLPSADEIGFEVMRNDPTSIITMESVRKILFAIKKLGNFG